jgi:hypothetical protein
VSVPKKIEKFNKNIDYLISKKKKMERNAKARIDNFSGFIYRTKAIN